MKVLGSRWALALLVVALRAAPVLGQERPADPSDLVNAVLGGLLGFREVTGPELESEVAELGGVPFKAAVPLDYLSPAELERYLTEVFDAEYPPERARADERTLVAFDLLSPEVALRALRARVLKDNVAGFYDERPTRRRLYAVSQERRLTPANQLVISHELRHALQDQYASVHQAVPAEVGDFDDRRLAYISLLEGDATLVMERFLLKRLEGTGLANADLTAATWPVPAMPGVPAVVRDQLVLPYIVGRDFARALHQRGGWHALREAWTSPPRSTEQVLHPDKFFAREGAQAVGIAFAPRGGRPLLEGVLGELLLRTLLGAKDDAAPPTGAPGAGEVETAAAGWGGDAFRTWDVGGRTLMVWRSVWDGPQDAGEFQQALLRRLEASHGRGRPFEGGTLFNRERWNRVVVAGAGTVALVASDDPGLLVTALREGRAEK